MDAHAKEADHLDEAGEHRDEAGVGLLSRLGDPFQHAMGPIFHRLRLVDGHRLVRQTLLAN